MVGPEVIRKIRPRPYWIRKNVGYFALFVGALLAKIRVTGKWHLPKKGPYIIACNHFSYVDPAFFKYAIQKPINFLAASDQEIEKHFMWFVYLYGFIPIDRKNLAPSTIKLAKQVFKNGGILGIFPEGTSTTRELREPKNGAVYLSSIGNVPIVPMAIYGAETAWEDIFRGIRSRVRINIGKPFGPFNLSGNKTEKTIQMKKNAKEMMSRIAALLPDENHGICSGDYKIKDYQDQNGIMPKLIDF
tara:strand:+ start:413 stop:1147 length:735 start_codon:yes stop_codon:yes gene_type:complete